MREKRIYGPPGTGKTTHLATNIVPAASVKFGQDRVMITSFTRTAAHEIATKKSLETGETIPIDLSNVGTLHALIYRAIGQPKIAQLNTKTWNESYPHLAVGDTSQGAMDDDTVVMDVGTSNNDGDVLLNQMDIFRAKMISDSIWPQKLKEFAQLWNQWKQEMGFMDFTDLIEHGLNQMPYAPNNPSVIIVDEAQDFTVLQLSVLRNWAQHIDWLALIGDDEQSIYTFAGATPDAFLKPELEAKYQQTLTQSYRLPRAVHAYAQLISNRISYKVVKTYQPRAFDGEVRFLNEHYQNPSKTIEIAKQCTQAGKSLMILTTCSYMLNKILFELKKNGIPFYNPYRKKRGDWNLLVRGDKSKVTSVDLISSFLNRGEDENYWNVADFITWAQHLSVGDNGLIRKQGNAAIEKLKRAVEEQADGLHSCRNILSKVLSPAAIEPAMNRNVDWFAENLKTGRQKSITYPLAVANKFGIDCLSRPPAVIPGTIHSVKGGEADVVILYPDISMNAMREKLYNGREAQDAIWRVFYVGATRAKETLIIMKPTPSANGCFMPLDSM